MTRAATIVAIALMLSGSPSMASDDSEADQAKSDAFDSMTRHGVVDDDAIRRAIDRSYAPQDSADEVELKARRRLDEDSN